MPKETVRRKVLELDKIGALKRIKKQIIIDRSIFSQVKPERQVKITAKYIYLYLKFLIKMEFIQKNLIQNLLKIQLKKFQFMLEMVL